MRRMWLRWQKAAISSLGMSILSLMRSSRLKAAEGTRQRPNLLQILLAGLETH